MGRSDTKPWLLELEIGLLIKQFSAVAKTDIDTWRLRRGKWKNTNTVHHMPTDLPWGYLDEITKLYQEIARGKRNPGLRKPFMLLGPIKQ